MDRGLFARLVIFYEKFRPENINASILNEIIAKYGNNPAKMFQKLQKKYGEYPPVEVSIKRVKEILAKYGLEGEYTPPIQPKAQDESPKDKESDDGEIITSEPVLTVIPGEEEGEVYVRREEDVAQEIFLRSLDFLSPDFDPLLALTCDHPSVQESLPAPHVKPLDNISKCRNLLPETDEDYSDLGRKPGHNMDPKDFAKGRPIQPEPVRRLAESLKDGPYSVLFKCFKSNEKVSVMVRRVNSIRGVCTGYLKAYDRHMNLVLYDVEEKYTVMVQRKKKKKKKKKSKKKPKHRGEKPEEKTKSEIDEKHDEDSSKHVDHEANERISVHQKQHQDEKPIVRQDNSPSETQIKSPISDQENTQKQGQQASTPGSVLVQRSRQMKKILVRGDNVVMLWPTKSGESKAI